MDIASITATLASLKAAKEIGQGLLELKSVTDIQTKVIELQNLILAAQSSALDARGECIDLVEKNAELQQKLRLLNEQMETRQNMIYRDDVYWMPKEGGIDEGPYCPRCLDGPHHL